MFRNLRKDVNKRNGTTMSGHTHALSASFSLIFGAARIGTSLTILRFIGRNDWKTALVVRYLAEKLVCRIFNILETHEYAALESSAPPAEIIWSMELYNLKRFLPFS